MLGNIQAYCYIDVKLSCYMVIESYVTLEDTLQ
jgi:hypothetical protein